MPYQYMQAIHTVFPDCVERFASPLDVHDNTSTYFSNVASHSTFGARQDAFSEPWLGHSFAHPPTKQG